MPHFDRPIGTNAATLFWPVLRCSTPLEIVSVIFAEDIALDSSGSNSKNRNFKKKEANFFCRVISRKSETLTSREQRQVS